MSSSLTVGKLTQSLKVTHVRYTAGDTSNDYAGGWVDMRDFEAALLSYIRTTGTGGLSNFDIYAASDSSGSNATLVKSGSANPDAVGDYCFLEVLASEVRQVDVNNVGLRYLSLKTTQVTGSDVGVITWILGLPRFANDTLTTDSIS